jgi:hypothetical protein
MEDGEAVMEERRDVAMPLVQRAKQQESREVTYLEEQKSWAGAKEVDLLMDGNPQAISDTESLAASEPTILKGPKNKRWRGEGHGPDT